MRDILIFDSVTSTNTLLKEMADKKVKEGVAILARAQTAGKGRMGRFFFSPPRTGIYMSILLRPDFPAQDLKFLTPMAAVAVSKAIEKISGDTTEIKWVNDIYMKDKKVCGILTEASIKEDKINYAIIGIGVNLEPPKSGFPKEIKSVAGGIFEKAPEGAFECLYKEIYDNILSYYRKFKDKKFIGEYIKKCTYLKGREITVSDGDNTYTAVADIPDLECRLKVTDSSGKEMLLYSGEANILKNGEVCS